MGTCRRDPTVAVAPVSAITRGSSSTRGPDGRRGLAHERRASVGRCGRPSRLGLLAAAAAARASATVALGARPRLLGGGVDHLVGAARGVDPFAADEELGLVALGGLGHVCSLVGRAPADLTARHIQPRPAPGRQSRWHGGSSARRAVGGPELRPAPVGAGDGDPVEPAAGPDRRHGGVGVSNRVSIMTFVTSQGHMTCAIL